MICSLEYRIRKLEKLLLEAEAPVVDKDYLYDLVSSRDVQGLKQLLKTNKLLGTTEDQGNLLIYHCLVAGITDMDFLKKIFNSTTIRACDRHALNQLWRVPFGYGIGQIPKESYKAFAKLVPSVYKVLKSRGVDPLEWSSSEVVDRQTHFLFDALYDAKILPIRWLRRNVDKFSVSLIQYLTDKISTLDDSFLEYRPDIKRYLIGQLEFDETKDYETELTLRFLDEFVQYCKDDQMVKVRNLVNSNPKILKLKKFKDAIKGIYTYTANRVRQGFDPELDDKEEADYDF